MRRIRGLESAEQGTEIDLTPMIDMVFILLVFFIVSTSFVKEAGITVERPGASTGEAKNPQVIIAVDKKNVIWLQGNTVDIRMLPVKITQLKNQQEDLSIIIASDKKADVGTLVKILDTCREKGVEDVSVATKDPK